MGGGAGGGYRSFVPKLCVQVFGNVYLKLFCYTSVINIVSKSSLDLTYLKSTYVCLLIFKKFLLPHMVWNHSKLFSDIIIVSACCWRPKSDIEIVPVPGYRKEDVIVNKIHPIFSVLQQCVVICFLHLFSLPLCTYYKSSDSLPVY